MISGNHSIYDVLAARVGFDFERNHDPKAFRQWAIENSKHGWTIAAVYVVVILVLKRFMRIRQKINLRWPLAFWNLLTAVFSIMASARTLPYLFRMLSTYGVMFTICDESLYLDEVVSFWGSCFMISKVPELADTLFVVFRKQELIFLHFYHHASVVVFVFLSYPSWVGSGLFYMTMNYTVHAFMYTYYMFRAFGYKIPRLISVSVTSLQIAQMILACAITAAVYYRLAIAEEACGTETLNQVHRTFIVYFSYFVLFIHYFVGAYLAPKKLTEKVIKTE